MGLMNHAVFFVQKNIGIINIKFWLLYIYIYIYIYVCVCVCLLCNIASCRENNLWGNWNNVNSVQLVC